MEAGNIVTQVKTADKDGYAAVQVGAGRQAGRCDPSTWLLRIQFKTLTMHTLCMPSAQVGYKVCREDKITKPEVGHLSKAGAPAMKHLREFKVGLKREGWQPAQRVQRIQKPTGCAPPKTNSACWVSSHAPSLPPCPCLPIL